MLPYLTDSNHENEIISIYDSYKKYIDSNVETVESKLIYEISFNLQGSHIAPGTKGDLFFVLNGPEIRRVSTTARINDILSFVSNRIPTNNIYFVEMDRKESEKDLYLILIIYRAASILTPESIYAVNILKSNQPEFYGAKREYDVNRPFSTFLKEMIDEDKKPGYFLNLNQISVAVLKTNQPRTFGDNVPILKPSHFPINLYPEYNRNELILILNSVTFASKKELKESYGVYLRFTLHTSEGEQIWVTPVAKLAKNFKSYFWNDCYSLKLPDLSNLSSLKNLLQIEIFSHYEKTGTATVNLVCKADWEIYGDSNKLFKKSGHHQITVGQFCVNLETNLISMLHTDNEIIYQLLNTDPGVIIFNKFREENSVPIFEIQKFYKQLLVKMLTIITNRAQLKNTQEQFAIFSAIIHVLSQLHSKLYQQSFDEFLKDFELNQVILQQKPPIAWLAINLLECFIHCVSRKEHVNSNEFIKNMVSLMRLVMKFQMLEQASITTESEKETHKKELSVKIGLLFENFETRMQNPKEDLTLFKYLIQIGCSIDFLKEIISLDLLQSHITAILNSLLKKYYHSDDKYIFIMTSQNFLPPLIASDIIFYKKCNSQESLCLDVWMALKRGLNHHLLKKNKSEEKFDNLTSFWFTNIRRFIINLITFWFNSPSTDFANPQLSNIDDTSTLASDPVDLTLQTTDYSDVFVDRSNLEDSNVCKIRLLRSKSKSAQSGNLIRFFLKKIAFFRNILDDKDSKSDQKISSDITCTLAFGLVTLLANIKTQKIWLGVMEINSSTEYQPMVRRGTIKAQELPGYFSYCAAYTQCEMCSANSIEPIWTRVMELLKAFKWLNDNTKTICLSDSDTLKFDSTCNSIKIRYLLDMTIKFRENIIRILDEIFQFIVRPIFIKQETAEEATLPFLALGHKFSTEVLVALLEAISSFVDPNLLVISFPNDFSVSFNSHFISGCTLFLKIWNSLDDLNQRNNIESFATNIFPFVLPEVESVRKNIVEVYGKMAEINFNSTKHALITIIDKYIHKTSNSNFVNDFINLFRVNKIVSNSFINDIDEQLELLIGLRELEKKVHAPLPYFMCLNHLLNFYKRIDRSDLIQKYLWNLVKFYQKSAEKGEKFPLELGFLYDEISKYYEWTNDSISKEVLNLIPESFNVKTQTELKEVLIKMALRELESLYFESAIAICDNLTSYYCESVEYEKLKDILSKKSELYHKILSEEVRCSSKFALLTFTNSSFPIYISKVKGQSLLDFFQTQNTYKDSKEHNTHTFILRYSDSTMDMHDYITKNFTDCEILVDPKKLLDTFRIPIVFLQTSSTELEHELPERMRNMQLRKKLTKYYEDNEGRRIIKNDYLRKNQNDKWTKSIESTFESEKKFPNFLPIYPITTCQKRERSEIEVALKMLGNTLNDMRLAYDDFMADVKNISVQNRMIECLNRHIMSGVMGGLRNYLYFKSQDEQDDPTSYMQMTDYLQKLLNLYFDVLLHQDCLNDEKLSLYLEQFQKLSEELKVHFSLNLDLDYEKLRVKSNDQSIRYTRNKLNPAQLQIPFTETRAPATNPRPSSSTISQEATASNSVCLTLPEAPPIIPSNLEIKLRHSFLNGTDEISLDLLDNDEPKSERSSDEVKFGPRNITRKPIILSRPSNQVDQPAVEKTPKTPPPLPPKPQ